MAGDATSKAIQVTSDLVIIAPITSGQPLTPTSVNQQ